MGQIHLRVASTSECTAIASHGDKHYQFNAPNVEQCRSGTQFTSTTAHTSLNAHTVGVGIMALTGKGGSTKLL